MNEIEQIFSELYYINYYMCKCDTLHSIFGAANMILSYIFDLEDPSIRLDRSFVPKNPMNEYPPIV